MKGNKKAGSCLMLALLLSSTLTPSLGSLSRAYALDSSNNAFTNTLGIKTMEEYDSLIRASYNGVITPELKTLILKRALVKRVGYDNLLNLAKNTDNYNMLSWLLSNEYALELYLQGGFSAGSYTKSMEVLSKLYKTYKEDFSKEVFLKLALSISLTHSATVKLWTNSNLVSDPAERYRIYKDLYNSGKLSNNEEFSKLHVCDMRWVVNNAIDDEEIEWLNKYARTHKGRAKEYNLDPYNYIIYGFGYNYNKWDYYNPANKEKWTKKYDLDGITYGVVGNNKLWMVFKEGGVCGALSKTGSNLEQSFGRPAAVVGQPAHAAYLHYSVDSQGRSRWDIGNNIFGYQESERGKAPLLGMPVPGYMSYYGISYILLYQAFLDSPGFSNSWYLASLAESYTDYDMRVKILRKALKEDEFNIFALNGLMETFKTKDNPDSGLKWIDEFVLSHYKYYPLVMSDIMKYVGGYMKDGTLKASEAVRRVNMLKMVRNTQDKDYYMSYVTRDMANYILGHMGKNENIFSFSFSGPNKNKIVLSKDYDNYDVRIRYSLDGGKTFKESNDKAISLSKEEVDSISTVGILVGFVGTPSLYKIDITKGDKPNNGSLYKNDDENMLYGDTSNLEFSLDKGQTWKDYTGQRFDDDLVGVKVRYKAHDTKLQSDMDSYTFTKANYDKKYVYLFHNAIESFSTSSAQNNSSKNAIDGNLNTLWHSSYGGDNNRYAIIKFKKDEKVSKLRLYPRGDNSNGVFKDVVLYSSQDGKNWSQIYEGSFANNGSGKDLVISNPSNIRYIKIWAKHTYGNHDFERDKFFALRNIEVYVDESETNTRVARSIEDETKPSEVETPVAKPSGDSVTNPSVEVPSTKPSGEESVVKPKVDNPVVTPKESEPVVKPKEVAPVVVTPSKEEVTKPKVKEVTNEEEAKPKEETPRVKPEVVPSSPEAVVDPVVNKEAKPDINTNSKDKSPLETTTEPKEDTSNIDTVSGTVPSSKEDTTSQNSEIKIINNNDTGVTKNPNCDDCCDTENATSDKVCEPVDNSAVNDNLPENNIKKVEEKEIKAEVLNRNDKDKVLNKHDKEKVISPNIDIKNFNPKALDTEISNVKPKGDNITAKIQKKALESKTEDNKPILNPLVFESLYGSDRYETNRKTLENFKSDTLVLVNGYNLADSLSAINVVNKTHGKLMFIDRNGLNLDNLDGIKKAYIIGGEKSLSLYVKAKLRKANIEVVTISGSDRYDTNKKTLDMFGYNNVLVCSGENLYDSLASAPLAKAKNLGVLLVRESINNSDRDKYNIEFTIGGDKSVSNPVGVLLAGSNREATNDAINAYLGKVDSTIYVGRSKSADALSSINLLTNYKDKKFRIKLVSSEDQVIRDKNNYQVGHI